MALCFILFVNGVGLGLGGCAAGARTGVDLEARSEAPKAIEVVSVSHRLTLHFAADDLTPLPLRAREESVEALLASGDIGESDEVRVERGAGVLSEARAGAVAAVLRRAGFKAEVAEVAVVPETEVHVVVTHALAMVRGCPDWSDVSGDGPRNAMPRDFGCSVAGDLAAMIADPRDLVRGRRLSPAVGDPALYAMRRYRYGDPPSAGATAPVNIIAPTTTNATAPPPAQGAGPAPAPPSGATAAGASPGRPS